VADAIVVNIAGLLAAKLGTTKCAETYLHDIRRAVGQAELPALAVYVADEEIVDGRADEIYHEATVQLDYYLGPIEQDIMNDRWADLRIAARMIGEVLRAGSHAAWPTPIVPAPDPPQNPAPGTPLVDLGIGLEAFALGRIRYGYFHPIAPGPGTSYLGFRAPLAVRHVDLADQPGISNLTEMYGVVRLPAEGALPVVEFVEFRAL
jgi:hypothetical protein